MGAALVLAACDSSKDSLLNTGGRGGNANGGAAGGTAGAASAGRGGGSGAGGAPACEMLQCVRPYECITACGGPIISNNCCQCQAPAFDNFMNMACGGSGGRGGAGGAAGTAGGAPGGSGGAGSGGRGGGAAGTAGSGGAGSSGRGGASGAAGTASGGTGGNVDGGTDAFNCATASCARPYLCVNACGGPVISNNCCACVAPAFDDFMGMACGDGGTGAISYVGCRYIGGYDRIVVAKRDTSRDICVNVVLIDGTTPAPAGLTLPPSFTLDSATVGPASACPTMARLPTVGGPVTGSVVSTSPGTSLPSTVDVDIHVTLPGNDEAIIARGVNVAGACL